VTEPRPSTGSPVGDAEVRALGLALVASLLLWHLPFGGILLYPFKLLATWMHEISHGVVMLITGAGFDHMDVYRDGSGLAYAQRKVGDIGRALVAAAGYMGTPVFGAGFLIFGQTARAARRALGVIGALLVATALIAIGGRFGQIAVACTGAVALVGALALGDRWVIQVANFIAAQACVNAVVDIRVLYRPTLVVDGKVMRSSDAHTMADATFGTTEPWAIWLWATVWLVWSLVLFSAALIAARKRYPPQPAPAAVEMPAASPAPTPPTPERS